jgi:hypothetical protein
MLLASELSTRQLPDSMPPSRITPTDPGHEPHTNAAGSRTQGYQDVEELLGAGVYTTSTSSI